MRIARECVAESGRVFHESANRSLEFLVNAIKPEYPEECDQVFNFLHAITGYQHSLRAKQYEDFNMFIGSLPSEKEQSRLQMMQRMWTQAFSLSVEESNKPQLDAFTRMVNYGKPASDTELELEITRTQRPQKTMTPSTPASTVRQMSSVDFSSSYITPPPLLVVPDIETPPKPEDAGQYVPPPPPGAPPESEDEDSVDDEMMAKDAKMVDTDSDEDSDDESDSSDDDDDDDDDDSDEEELTPEED